jgi:hypothetical protein
MARAKAEPNGELSGLRQIMRDLAQSQANLVQTQSNMLETQATLAPTQASLSSQIDATNRLNSERFARIERILFEHKQILTDLSRNIERWPEAAREKIGFKGS